MPNLFDYIDEHGRNPFKEWSLGLGKVELGKLNRKLDLLQGHGNELPPGLLSDSDVPTIKKIRINGQVAIRPLLCRGPLNMEANAEFTLLMGAYERDRKLPIGVLRNAEHARQVILNNPDRRREHERVTWNSTERI